MIYQPKGVIFYLAYACNKDIYKFSLLYFLVIIE